MSEATLDGGAITELEYCYQAAVSSAEQYRHAAETKPAQRDFFHALSTTYVRIAREANVMLKTIERTRRVTE